MNPEALKALVSEGASLSAGKLTELTGCEWVLDKVELSIEDGAPFDRLLAGIARDHYGSHFSIDGATFLVMFSGKSGYLVSTSFTRDHQDLLESMDKRELRTLAEAANIFLNPMIGHFAQAWKKPIIVSAPRMQVSSQRDLLATALQSFKDRDRLSCSFLIRLASPNLFSDCMIAIFLHEALTELAR
jgi:hypothetical protein